MSVPGDGEALRADSGSCSYGFDSWIGGGGVSMPGGGTGDGEGNAMSACRRLACVQAGSGRSRQDLAGQVGAGRSR